MKYDYLIVGAGLSGCVSAERIANQLGGKCLIVEKRSHIGGNCYDYRDENGLIVHKYGPHIFHTNIKKVWNYLADFTEWSEYYHKVTAVSEGIAVPLPFNLNSIEKIFPSAFAKILETKLIEKYGFGIKIPILKLIENEDKDLKFLADYVYKNIFLGYTLKQWGLKPEDIDPSVTARIPVYISRDDRYFQDTYQAIPKKGYTEIFKKLVNHKNIHVMLSADYRDIIEDIKYDRMIYTGPLDEFFGHKFGALPYRSLNFKLETLDKEYFQANAQVNYPNNHDYTRITEFKHFLNYSKSNKTTIAYEYPCQSDEFNEPYYPIQTAETELLSAKYKSEIDALKDKVFFTGRLADYKYYNMDQTISAALMLFDKTISKLELIK